MLETAKELGVDPNDPFQNIEGGARYLRQNLDKYEGNYAKAIASYNAGPNHPAIVKGDSRFLPEETQSYLGKFRDFVMSSAHADESPSEQVTVLGPADEQLTVLGPADDPIPRSTTGATGSWADKPASSEKVGMDQTAIDKAAQGLTFGFGDEILGGVLGGIDAAFTPWEGDEKLSIKERYNKYYKSYRDAQRARLEAEQNQHPVVSTVAEIAGSAAGGTGLAKVAPKVFAVGSDAGYLRNIASAVKAGAAQGALYGAGESKAEDIDGVIADALSSGSSSALFGGGMAATLGPAVKIGGKAVDSIREYTKFKPQIEKNIATAQKLGIPYAPVDALPSLHKPGVTLENIPFSPMTAYREAQQQAWQKAMGLTDEASQFADDFKLGERIETPGQSIKNEFNKLLKARKKVANENYGTLGDMLDLSKAANPGSDIVNLKWTAATAKKLFDEHQDIFSGLNQDTLKRQLQILVTGLDDNKAQLSFDQVQKLRSNLTDAISTAYRSGKGDNAVRVLGEIKRVLDDVDIESWGNLHKSPAVRDQFKTAVSQWRHEVKAPYNKDNPNGGSLLHKITRDKISDDDVMKSIVKKNNPTTVEHAMENVTPEGRDMIQRQFLQDTIDDAYGYHGVSNSEFFSPQKFSSGILNNDKKGQSVLDRLFGNYHQRPDSGGLNLSPMFTGNLNGRAQELRDVAELARSTARSGQYLENPPTGVRLQNHISGVSGLGLGGAIGTAVGGPVGTAVGAGLGFLTQHQIAKIMSNPDTFKMLGRVAKMVPGPERDELIKQMMFSAGLATTREWNENQKEGK